MGDGSRPRAGSASGSLARKAMSARKPPRPSKMDSNRLIVGLEVRAARGRRPRLVAAVVTITAASLTRSHPMTTTPAKVMPAIGRSPRPVERDRRSRMPPSSHSSGRMRTEERHPPAGSGSSHGSSGPSKGAVPLDAIGCTCVTRTMRFVAARCPPSGSRSSLVLPRSAREPPEPQRMRGSRLETQRDRPVLAGDGLPAPDRRYGRGVGSSSAGIRVPIVARRPSGGSVTCF